MNRLVYIYTTYLRLNKGKVAMIKQVVLTMPICAIGSMKGSTAVSLENEHHENIFRFTKVMIIFTDTAIIQLTSF